MSGLTPTMRSDIHLPPEVWHMTLAYLRERKSQEELAYLWLKARLVSRQFKQEIEEIFRTEHLPKTWLHFHQSEFKNDFFV